MTKLFLKIEENKLFGMFQWYILSSLDISLDTFVDSKYGLLPLKKTPEKSLFL